MRECNAGQGSLRLETVAIHKVLGDELALHLAVQLACRSFVLSCEPEALKPQKP